ncbi:leucyl/phenylalanyl-tRNA--protein transferase [Pedobacter sp. LMG 31464]|uniref:Leucyl/phenylalanyl-tRNA--protein transferase n=1 Tax=Pedobacter planticolens TaxID=2679964 RepID=A0A923E0A9_9SPHI|nr:leucyl/phenylalanyl-tRNA--protein transferase [Pedobacter planticolens]MBB2146063.1 leucyl/phenylalanyl-tRNA--protein transferase [Pedobacter planticolens]
MVFRLLDDEIIFPNTALADPDGLLAIGGDLSVERLLLAYQSGIFPWFSEDDPILWYAPYERCVIYPDRIKISKSMRKVLQAEVFEITVNQAFDKVIENCAKTPRVGQDGTWITNDMQKAYLNLHKKGLAHSIEVWQDEKLVGGLYGVKINTVFCGESMFSLVSNASKVALIHLSKNIGFELIDCQLPNEHLMSLGAEMISRKKYLSMLGSL